MVVEAPDNVATIAANVNVFSPFGEYKRVRRQVRFKKTPVGLGFNLI